MYTTYTSWLRFARNEYFISNASLHSKSNQPRAHRRCEVLTRIEDFSHEQSLALLLPREGLAGDTRCLCITTSRLRGRGDVPPSYVQSQTLSSCAYRTGPHNLNGYGYLVFIVKQGKLLPGFFRSTDPWLGCETDPTAMSRVRQASLFLPLDFVDGGGRRRT
jgi:hypothetical protein